MANGGRDTADSEFFITATDEAGSTSPISLANMPQFLNFRYTIFGQLVSGFDTFEKIMSTTVQAQSDPGFNGEVSLPTSSITVTSAQVIDDTQDAVLQVFVPSFFTGNSATITVTATNSDNETSQQSFTAMAVSDTNVDPPFLRALPTNLTVASGHTLNFTLQSTDLSGAGIDYEIGSLDNTPNANFDVDHNTGLVTITPDASFSGTLHLVVGVRAASADNVFSNFDVQEFTVAVVGTTLDAVANQTTVTGVADSLTLHGTDGAGDGVAYSIVDATTLAAPEHVTVNIDQITGAVTLTPEAGFSGTLDLLARAIGANSPNVPANYVTQPFTLTVAALNPVASQTAAVGAPIDLALTTSPSASNVFYAILDANTLSAPDHVTVSINQSTGEATIQPDAGFTGTLNLLAEMRASGADDLPANYVTQDVYCGLRRADAWTNCRSNDWAWRCERCSASRPRFARQ